MQVVEQGVAVVGADDVLVFDRPAEVGLPQEALDVAGLLQKVRVDHLQGDRTAGVEPRHGPGHLRPVDLAHASAAQLREELVRTESNKLVVFTTLNLS